MMSRPLLIAEDDRDLRHAICITLELAGYPVIAATDGCEALTILAQQRIGLVISDVQMQPLDGFALLREVRRLHADVPVILMTAFGDIENAVAAMQEGASDYLAKPFESGRLLETVQRHLHQLASPCGIDCAAGGTKPGAVLPVATNMKSVERAHIMATLLSVRGSRKQAVERLGISERALRYKLKQYQTETMN